ncbi:MAG: ATP synthase F1 subunit gamma [Gemmatimonadetes bacterium]|nr:ATP synthase F1 subunit gamma [Gemmatimonadota bacterium]
MARPRELRRRIKSVESTRKITKTMEMVATSKLKRAQDRVVAARPYAQALANVIADLYTPELAERFPLLRQPKGVPKKAAVLFITSNRGLCGAFNSNLIKEARRTTADLEARGCQVDLHGIGRKGIGFFRYTKRALAVARQDVGDRPSQKHAEELVEPLMRQFETGLLDAVFVVFAKFNSPVSTPPTTLQILPVVPPSAGKAGGKSSNYILSPSADEIVGAILPLYVRNAMYRALVETAAGEQGARRTAMKNATDSASDMIDSLRQTYNRVRQAQITQEIAEIVGGSEALKG